MQPAKLVVRTVMALGLGALAVMGCGSSTTSGGADASSNPPGCPPEAPAGGAACAVAEGSGCSYGCEQGGPATASCSGGKWSVARSNVACTVGSSDAGPPPAPAPFACGSQTCGVTQYCINPCCGGAPPECQPMPDSGVCPAGMHPGTCAFGGGSGCVQDPCTPPPPFCADDPSQAPSQCSGINRSGTSRQVYCACA